MINVIASNDSVCLMIYSDIGTNNDEITSREFVKEFNNALSISKNIDIRINSLGGNVFEGMAIFNTLKNSKANINIYIDGIAASMAMVIAQCGKPLHAARFSRLMIHACSKNTFGNAVELTKQIKELKSIDDTLAEIYAKRSGKTKQEIINQFFDGDDHWLTAQEALELGFIDSIFDSEQIVTETQPKEICNIVTQSFYDSKNPKNMLNKIREIPTFINMVTEKEVVNHIKNMIEQNSVLQKEVKELKEQVQTSLNLKIEEKIKSVNNKALHPALRTAFETNFEHGETIANAIISTQQQPKVIDMIENQTFNMSSWEQKQKQIKNNLKN